MIDFEMVGEWVLSIVVIVILIGSVYTVIDTWRNRGK